MLECLFCDIFGGFDILDLAAKQNRAQDFLA